MASMPDFWIEHKKRLRGYIAKRVREPSAVDDILQDVFVKAYTNLHTVKSRGSLTAWLYRIAANAIAFCGAMDRNRLGQVGNGSLGRIIGRQIGLRPHAAQG